MEPLEVTEEAIRTLLFLGGTLFLAWRGHTHRLHHRPGWNLILAGLIILTVGSILDLFDEFEAMGALPSSLIGEPWGAIEIYTEFVGPSVGTSLLMVGFLLWLPLPARLSQMEADLRQAHETLQGRANATKSAWDTLVQNAPDYILLIDEQERIAYANRTPAGLPMDQVLGQPIGGFVPDPVEREAMLKAIRQALAGGAPSKVEVVGPGHDGKPASYSLRIMPSVQPNGRPAALMLNIDISEDLHVRDALRQRQNDLEEAQSIAHVGSWEADLTTGLAYESKEAWRIWGMSGDPEPRPMSDFLDLIHPDDKAALDAKVTAALARNEDYEGLLRIRGRAPGEWRHVRNRGRIAKRTPDGQPIKLTGTLEDVTERLAAEQRLRESDERFRMAAAATQDVVWDYDVAADRLTWGDAMGTTLGHDPSTLDPGLASWTRNVHPDDVAKAVRGFQAALDAGAVQWQSDYRFRRANGSWAQVLDRCTIVRGPDGKARRAVGAMTDITALKDAEARLREQALEAQRLEQASAFKTQFLNMAAHELATPLTPLKLQMATLRQQPGRTAEDLVAFDLLERNVNRMGTLVNDLLDAARLQSGRLRLAPKPVGLERLLRHVTGTFAAQAREAGITLGIQPSVGTHVAVGDETRLTQVLVNLVHNALKFTPRGGQVWLREDVDGQNAVLTVRDTGIGLTPQQTARLFQPFTQVHDPTQAAVAGGTGLGLYIARGIVQQHGGDLTVSSHGPGRGSTFKVRFPLSGPADASAPGNGQEPLPAASARDARRAAP